MKDNTTNTPSSDPVSRARNCRPPTFGRRDFIKRTAASGAALALYAAHPALPESAETARDLPERLLGRTKQKVSILGLGTAPVGEGPVGLQEGIKIFSEVIDRGVNYVDTARIYGNAEEILGHVIPKRRDNLFLVTKVSTHTAAEAERSLSQSLRMLKTDHLDLVHIHSIGSKRLERVLAADGALQYLLDQKDKGKIRFIGISGHNRPPNFVKMLQTDQIDVLMCVMNYADRNIYDFEAKVLPEAKKRNVACVAMKVYAGIKGGFPNHRKGYVGCATTADLLPHALAYALDLQQVSVAVVGPYTIEQAIQNVRFARRYKPLNEQQRASLLESGKKLAETLGPRYGPVA
ncbi:MAG: aldo/keto reductase [Phycisphaerales bacterium]|nr:MAG: aldo/keto reductase [Phycisphaerales bacterium]